MALELRRPPHQEQPAQHLPSRPSRHCPCPCPSYWDTGSAAGEAIRQPNYAAVHKVIVSIYEMLACAWVRESYL